MLCRGRPATRCADAGRVRGRRARRSRCRSRVASDWVGPHRVATGAGSLSTDSLPGNTRCQPSPRGRQQSNPVHMTRSAVALAACARSCRGRTGRTNNKRLIDRLVIVADRQRRGPGPDRVDPDLTPDGAWTRRSTCSKVRSRCSWMALSGCYPPGELRSSPVAFRSRRRRCADRRNPDPRAATFLKGRQVAALGYHD